MSWHLDARIGHPSTPPVLYSTTDTAGPDYGLLDGLTITDAIEESELWPGWPTTTATFGIVAPTAADLAHVVLGAPVSLAWTTPAAAAAALVRFDGRIADVTIRPHGLGVLADCVAADYPTAELAELTADAARPAEDAWTRLVALMAYHPRPLVRVAPWPGAPTPYSPPITARAADPAPVLGLVRDLLATWALDYLWPARGLARYQIRAELTAGPGGANLAEGRDLYQWQAVAEFAARDAVELPARFGATPEVGGYGVTVAHTGPDKAALTVSASRIPRGGTAFTQRRGVLITRVDVTGPWGAGGASATVSGDTGETPPVAAKIETAWTLNTGGLLLVQLYLPEPGGTSWHADTFAWSLGATAGLTADQIPAIGDLTVVAGIASTYSPDRRPYYAGTLTRRVFRLDAGAPWLDLAIRPQLRPHTWAAGGLVLTDLPAGLTHADFNDRDTWNDYRLIAG